MNETERLSSVIIETVFFHTETHSKRVSLTSSQIAEWGKGRHHVFSPVFDRILFILAGNDDIHKSLHELEIRPDPTTDNRVSCP